MSGYWQVQEVFGQDCISVGDFLCSGSKLSTGILWKPGVSNVHRAGRDTHPTAWVWLQAVTSARGSHASWERYPRRLGPRVSPKRGREGEWSSGTKECSLEGVGSSTGLDSAGTHYSTSSAYSSSTVSKTRVLPIQAAILCCKSFA
jgi:hypothetical protein